MASGFNYDNGFGGAEVHGDLKIVGNDWWMERGEYDGSEWWEFKTLPKLLPADSKQIMQLNDTWGDEDEDE